MALANAFQQLQFGRASAIGVVLTVGGVQLAALGGSWYYLLAGLALIASGFFLVLRDVRGAWLYAATFAGTLIWAFWEKGLDGWALVPRLVGPLVLMFLVIAVLPVLRRGSGKLAGGSAIGLAVLTLAVTLTSQVYGTGALPTSTVKILGMTLCLALAALACLLRFPFIAWFGAVAIGIYFFDVRPHIQRIVNGDYGW